jgi:hypothetical protein
MESIEEIAKTFYARYGHTMHEIQVLENGLLEYYAIIEYIDKKLSNSEYYQILSNPKKLTLGHLVNLINSKGLLNEEILSQLKKANTFRIFLAHRFWWERDIEFDNKESLYNLHLEFTMYNNLIELLMQVFHNQTISLRNQYGLHIEEEMGLTDFKKRQAYIKSLTIINTR